MQAGAGGVMYPPNPSPIPMPDLGNLPSPKDVGEWFDEVMGGGKRQPGVNLNGQKPDPNDKEAWEKWKKVGKRWDKNGKRVDPEYEKELEKVLRS